MRFPRLAQSWEYGDPAEVLDRQAAIERNRAQRRRDCQTPDRPPDRYDLMARRADAMLQAKRAKRSGR